tara:strand:- start:72 stop:572 length:501 start_codon:yes stop_codon:yes gene_type:complete
MGTFPGGNVIRVKPTLDTSAYSAADLLFDKVEIPNFASSRGGASELVSISIHYDGSTDVDLTLMFFQNSTSLGANANDAASDISDSEFRAAAFQGAVYMEYGGASVTCGSGRIYIANSNTDNIMGLPLVLQAGEGSRSIWFAVINTGTPTYAADSLEFTFNVKYLG